MKIQCAYAASVLLFSLASFSPAMAQTRQIQHPPLLDQSFHEMYNLKFPEAHATLARYMAEHPQDPMGPVSDAAAYLFSEFDRTGVLNVALFTNDSSYLNHHTNPNPDVKKAFDAALVKANQLADAILAKNPNDASALLAKTLAFGLHADYTSLIERRDMAGFEYTKSGSVYAHKLLQVDPHAYDAYLAVGMENYILGLKPAPVRWFLRLAGGETNKAVGEKDLELTASQGHYLAPLAKLLLAVAALRDNDKPKARGLFASLAKEFPNNPLYARQLAKMG